MSLEIVREFQIVNSGLCANALAVNPVQGREGTPILWAPARELQVSIDFEF